jgi:hypothetical protein
MSFLHVLELGTKINRFTLGHHLFRNFLCRAFITHLLLPVFYAFKSCSNQFLEQTEFVDVASVRKFMLLLPVSDLLPKDMYESARG